MSLRRRPLRRLTALAAGAASTAVLLASLGASPGLAAANPSPTGVRSSASAQGAGTIGLLSQTATVADGERFDMVLDLQDVPADGSVEVTIHQRVRSRSELSASMDGESLRTAVYGFSQSVAELPVAGEGRRVSVSLDPAAPIGVPLSSAGVYPVRIVGRDAAGAEVATLVTHLLVEPDEDDESPALRVAVVAGLDGRPARQPDGTSSLPRAAIDRGAPLLEALADAGGPVNLALRPELVEALAGSEDPGDAELLALLEGLAAENPLVDLPYAATTPDALLAAGVPLELGHHLERGRRVLQDVLGTSPTEAVWLPTADLTDEGVELLRRLGFDHAVADPDHLEALRPGVVTYSLAQPFLIGIEEGPGVDALALDPGVLEHLNGDPAPGLEVSRALAELAVLWFERPGVPRANVLPLDPSVRPEVAAALVQGLSDSRIFEAVGLDEAFEGADPLVQPGGVQVDRPLVPDDPPDLSPAVARDLAGARSLQGSFLSLVGGDSALAGPLDAHLLLATSTALGDSAQRDHLDAARGLVQDVTGAVVTGDHERITLTAREGNIPLTIRNDAGVPLHVTVRLRSTKLEFPEGDTIAVTLTDPSTRLDIAVETRASGSFPMDVEITSPDGRVTLSTIDYSIQSTAVSGVGLVLSAGAAVFLLVWWARHWHRTRRSAKLVPDDAGDADDPEV